MGNFFGAVILFIVTFLVIALPSSVNAPAVLSEWCFVQLLVDSTGRAVISGQIQRRNLKFPFKTSSGFFIFFYQQVWARPAEGSMTDYRTFLGGLL